MHSYSIIFYMVVWLYKKQINNDCGNIIFLENFSSEEAMANSLVGNGCYCGKYKIHKDGQTTCYAF